MIKYLVEKENTIPLCAVKDDIYINYLKNEIIDDDKILKFIQKGINNRKIAIKDYILIIYEFGYINKNNKFVLLSYNYEINGQSNYLSRDLHLMSEEHRKILFDKKIRGKCFMRLKWNNGENI